MSYKSPQLRYQNWYTKLLRLYPKVYRERFTNEMKQTFNDLYREHREKNQTIMTFVATTFLDTFIQIIKEHVTTIFMQPITKKLSIWAVIVVLLLLIPLAAMQFTNEVQWSFGDFIFMGILLFGSACTYELIARKMHSNSYRLATGLAVVTSFVLIWVNAAVGIIGDGPVNLMYLGIILVGLIGAIAGRFSPNGMFSAMALTAIAQALVPVIALVVWGKQISWTPSIPLVFILNTIFALLFASSALLFRHATHRPKKSLHQSKTS